MFLRGGPITFFSNHKTPKFGGRFGVGSLRNAGSWECWVLVLKTLFEYVTDSSVGGYVAPHFGADGVGRGKWEVTVDGFTVFLLRVFPCRFSLLHGRGWISSRLCSTDSALWSRVHKRR